MEVSRASKRGRVYYLVNLKPEAFALGLYCLLLSVLVANLLWMNVLYLCSTLETLDIDYLVNQLIYIHFVFAGATTYVWWQLIQDDGKSVLTHVTFFVWQGSKLMASSLEICSFTRFYDKLVNNTPKGDIPVLTNKMTWGFIVIGLVECLGFVLAYKYLRMKKPKPTKSLSAPSMAV